METGNVMLLVAVLMGWIVGAATGYFLGKSIRALCRPAVKAQPSRQDVIAGIRINARLLGRKVKLNPAYSLEKLIEVREKLAREYEGSSVGE
jgi:hypothetical protein